MGKCRFDLSMDCHNKDCLDCTLDKIRAEVEEKYGDYDICEWFEDYDYEENDISEYQYVGDVSNILAIIDKYKAESEERMNEEEKERLIKKDIASIENRVRHAFNQGYEMGLKERKNTCDDAISRAEAIKAMNDLEQEDIERYGCHIPEGFDGERAIEVLQSLPSVKPQYTGDEIQKMQDLEQAEIEKAYELGKAEGQKSEVDNADSD